MDGARPANEGKRNVARGKKFGAPGEVPIYPRGNAALKTRRAHSHISLQGCVVTLSTRYLTLLTVMASKLRWANRGSDTSMRYLEELRGIGKNRQGFPKGL